MRARSGTAPTAVERLPWSCAAMARLMSSLPSASHGAMPCRSPSENADLLWGLRGGGGNFGIVTQFEFELHAVGPIVYAGPIFYSADADVELLRLFREWAPGASEDVTAVLNLTTAPPLPVIPEEW